MSRRDNGLQSADWGALVDVDPRLSEALLDSLAAAQVAAYVEPAGGQEPFTRATHLPDRPMDRLWIDPARADAARTVVAAEVADLTTLLAEREPGATAHGFVQAVPRTAARRVLAPPALPDPPRREPAGGALPDRPAPAPAQHDQDQHDQDRQDPAEHNPDEQDPDAIWRSIVDGFGREHDGPVPPWPVSEDVDPGPTQPLGGTAQSPGVGERRHPDRRGRPSDGSDSTIRWSTGSGSPGPRDSPAPDGPRESRAPGGDALPAWVEPDAVEDDGHYEPPPPPPVPRPALPRVLAVLAFVVGILLMFAPHALGQAQTSGVQLFGVLVTIAGTVAFVWLMRDTGDDAPDGGAQV